LARIALDAMGGDFAPRAPLAGALLALAELADEHVIELVGRSEVVREELTALTRGEFAHLAPVAERRLTIFDAPEVVAMSDRPTAALRSKPNSSMTVGLRRHAEGAADAFVSAGNTGAQMAASTVLLKLAPGLTRPAIGTVFPTARRPIVVLDSGANVDCSPQELVQFARLGAVYAEDMLGRPTPSVGLLSIGEEAEKGNTAVKEAHQLLVGTPGIEFQGNVEGRDLALGASDRGPLDVVVCDGFVGNVVLKFYEAMAPAVIRMVADHAKLAPEQFEPIMRLLDYSERGGAPLLGVRGISIICHGKSSPQAIKNGIKLAVQAVETRLAEHITRRLGAAAETVAS
jgi:glycerol-3-phosphate acyltransferase PlsX